MMQLLADLGLPRRVANLVLGAGAVARAPLASHPDVDMVSFTGGLETGKKIAAAAAVTVKRVALELGGKNPNVIFADADADFDAAIDNALNGAFVHSGQVCSAGARIIVEASIAERFVDELVRRANLIRLGGPFDPNAETGPLISAAHRDKVTAYVAKGVAEGCSRALRGAWGTGELENGYYYLPTILDRVKRGMSVVIDESFGPRASQWRPSRLRTRPSLPPTTPSTGSQAPSGLRTRDAGSGGAAPAPRNDLDQRLPPLPAAGGVGRIRPVRRRPRTWALRPRRVPGSQAHLPEHRTCRHRLVRRAEGRGIPVTKLVKTEFDYIVIVIGAARRAPPSQRG